MNHEKAFLPKTEYSQEEQEQKEAPVKTPYQEIFEAAESLSEKIRQEALSVEEAEKFANTVYENLGAVQKLDFFERLPFWEKETKQTFVKGKKLL